MATEDCLLLAIPSELRVLIFQYLFNLETWAINRLPGSIDYAAGCCNLHYHDGAIFARRKWGSPAFRNFTSIIYTCQVINREAMDVLFDQTLFNIRISDEWYNRKMRCLGSLDLCSPFLTRVKQVFIDPDVRQNTALICLPEILPPLLDKLESCSPEKTNVQISPSNGSFYGRIPVPLSRSSEDPYTSEEQRWREFLGETSLLRKRCKFRVKMPFLRQELSQRLEELIQAAEG